jgi:uncharacterized protein YjhX (UPF0386 family)
MARHRRVWNASVYDRYVREGRGSGWGPGYSPWIRVQDFPSRGVVSRIKGRTTGRVHHLLSNNELAYFYILDWSEKVTDIREQYPLSDLSLAVEIAVQAGVKYPTDNSSGYPYVLTCDFMITTADGLKARTIKMASELNNARTMEKLEIERRYWEMHSIEWKIVTEHEIPYQKAKNIEWLYSMLGFTWAGCNPDKLPQAREMLLWMLRNEEYGILEATRAIERDYQLVSGCGLQLFKQLVLNRAISINLDEPIDLNSKGAASKP